MIQRIYLQKILTIKNLRHYYQIIINYYKNKSILISKWNDINSEFINIVENIVKYVEGDTTQWAGNIRPYYDQSKKKDSFIDVKLDKEKFSSTTNSILIIIIIALGICSYFIYKKL